jgi:GTP:adenosylcobinamide-phosphate guanylyltransferase
MKQDKAWLEVDGVPMIERVIAAAGPAAGRLGIIVNAANPQVERYERLAESCDAGVIFDLHEHLGPLGGIHTALMHCGAGESALVLACDLPFITTEALSFLCGVHRVVNPQSAVRNPQSKSLLNHSLNRLGEDVYFAKSAVNVRRDANALELRMFYRCRDDPVLIEQVFV